MVIKITVQTISPKTALWKNADDYEYPGRGDKDIVWWWNKPSYKAKEQLFQNVKGSSPLTQSYSKMHVKDV